MKYEFKRIDEISISEFVNQMERQQAALDELLEGNAATSEALSYVEGILAGGRPCKGLPDGFFWGYDEPENMPGDARVDLFYMPTYLNTAFLMQAYSMMPDRLEARFPDFKEKLWRAMTSCAGREFVGHGYDRDDFVREMKIFASVHTKDFMRSCRELVPEAFSTAYRRALRSIERDVYDTEKYLKRVKGSWENDHLEDYRDILEAENAGRHTLFVYGSLMKGFYNHKGFLENAVFLGQAAISGFDIYDLGRYPGIKRSSDTAEAHTVLGELYEVNDDEYAAICELEGNGSLYQSETVPAYLDGSRDWMPAEVFVYLGRTEEKMKLSGNPQVWEKKSRETRSGTVAGTTDDYVWYACYGSNICRERFMRYIDRCQDQTPPAEDRPYEFVHPVFFAGESRTWNYKGKAFLDAESEGHAFGRVYRITRDQFLEVAYMEGSDYRNKILLGTMDGCQVVTFTCFNRPERSVPSLEYLNVILKGLKETYPLYRESALAGELIQGIFTADELAVLDCLREAEHGLRNEEIMEKTGLSGTEEKRAIASLIGVRVIRQDRRSRAFSMEDDRAVFFTEAGERDLIDRARALKSEAQEMAQVPADDPLTTPVMEGGKRKYLTTRYERVPANRLTAIRIHGTTCQVCGFNFEEHYGELGKDYIEVHYLRPLSSLEEEVEVDPVHDLACLCANCHRMMHRTGDHVMTVEELKRSYQ